MKQLPLEFTKRMMAILGQDGFALYEQALGKTQSRALRVNTEKLSLEDFEAKVDFKVEKIPYVENGYFFECDKIGNHPLHHLGAIYVQEPAAMMPAECLEVHKDWKILDMCASPGGKSTQLKNKLGDNGLLVSNEIIPSRCKTLVGNVERLGLKNTVVTCADSERISGAFPSFFDMIMVDAPCSGEGMFRKEEVAIDEWSVEHVRSCAHRQMQILENAAKALKVGGYIVYSTCTFSLEENEMTVDKFISSHPQFEIVPVREPIRANSEDGIAFEGCKCDNIAYTRRFYPHTGNGEGQFMAVLHDTRQAQISESARPASGKAQKQRSSGKGNTQIFDMSTVKDFLDSTLVSYDADSVKERNGMAIYFPFDFSGKEVSVFSCGINIGQVKKNYVLPHHNFFTAMGALFKNKIDLAPDSEELKKYLHGEEFEYDIADGWAVITVYGCALGGAKAVNGTVKNHYPKGLRTKG